MMTTPLVFSRNPDEWHILRQKHLVVVGTGSVGSAIALMGARAGVGRFTLIDPGSIEPENVGRHLCDLSAVGHTKVEAVKQLILSVNPQAVVSIYAHNLLKVIHDGFAITQDDISLLIGSTDSFACQSLLNVLSLESGVPSLFVGCWGAATVGEILYVRPGRTACYECYAHFRRDQEPQSDARQYVDPDFDNTRSPAQAGLWSNILIICGFAFQVALALLREPGSELIADTHSLFFVNVADVKSDLPFWAVSRGTVRQGCAVCDDALVEGIGD